MLFQIAVPVLEMLNCFLMFLSLTTVPVMSRVMVCEEFIYTSHMFLMSVRRISTTSTAISDYFPNLIKDGLKNAEFLKQPYNSPEH